MARPVWKGNITFGLVNVPVILHSGERRTNISFHLVDSRNSARIRYERVNEDTGEEVPWDKIVKGYKYEDNNYVLLSDDELEHASPEMTRSIDIETFVNLSDIDVRFFDRPYVLVPDKKGEKGYVLLREAIAKAGQAGIARVVIRARQHLAALMAQEDALILELLRFEQELRPLEEFELPHKNLRTYKVTAAEINLAQKLIGGMSAKWEPSQYEDEYRAALMELIEGKIKRGETEPIEIDEHDQAPPSTLNFMDVLKQSLSRTSRPPKKSRAKKPSRRRSGKKRRAG